MRLRAVLTVEYEADERVYGTGDPYAAAEIDEAECSAADFLQFAEPSIRVTPVEEPA